MNKKGKKYINIKCVSGISDRRVSYGNVPKSMQKPPLKGGVWSNFVILEVIGDLIFSLTKSNPSRIFVSIFKTI